MTPENSKQLVLIGVGGSAVLAVAGEVARTKEWPKNPRIIVGTFAAAIILTGISAAAPDVAGGIAAVMLLTSAFVYGKPAWEAIAKSLHP